MSSRKPLQIAVIATVIGLPVIAQQQDQDRDLDRDPED